MIERFFTTCQACGDEFVSPDGLDTCHGCTPSTPCVRCVALEIENARLKAENERLKRRLAIAKGVAENIRQGAKNRMDAGDLPRGNFAYLKGAYVSSDKISKTLG